MEEGDYDDDDDDDDDDSLIRGWCNNNINSRFLPQGN
jgi:hypothetical protein